MIPAGDYSKSLHESTSMRPMPRSLPSITQKYPMHTVTSQSRTVDKEDSGLTFSMEKSSETPAAQAEYEVLRAILAREGYLSRLHDIVRTVGKKFKPEIGDLLDLIRISSLDVIQAIEKWRETKGDSNATFVWNGLNYLLKMPSDLDYLADYLAIQKWMGFPLIRNPFCIPYPLESNNQNIEELINPQNIDLNNPEIAGYQIGGKKVSSTERKLSAKEAMAISSSPYAPKKKGKTGTELLTGKQATGKKDLSSFIFNEDMKKIRHAESVILAAEAKFGVFSRDPQGRLVPILQALTRRAASELKKDDKRPITEPASSSLVYAPHAANSEVGVAHASWTPEAALQSGSLEEKDSKETSKYFEEDVGVNPRLRGQGKSGGSLANFETKSADQRGRKPIKASISSTMDFRRQRNIKTFAERIKEIEDLKNEIEAAKHVLDEVDNEASPSNKSKSLSVSKLQVIRSALSNNVVTQSSKSTEELKMIPPPIEKYSYDKPADRDQLLAKLMKSAQATTNKVSVKSSEFISSSGGEQKTKSLKNNEDELMTPSKPASLYSSTTPSSPKALLRKGLSEKRSLSVSFTHNDLQENEELRSPPENHEIIPTKEELQVMQEVKEELERKLSKLSIEETAANRKLTYFLSDQKTVDKLKTNERVHRSKERSRDIERKRRLLTEEEGKRIGPPPEEEENVYDFYAIRVQALIRGWLARCWVKWYRANATRACIVIQSVLRGWFGRMRVRKMKHEYHSAMIIQKNFRGWNERGTSVTIAKQRNLMRAAIVIQRIWRGVLGQKRSDSKRKLDKAAKDAFDAVDAKSLVASDVKELSRRLLYAIEEPSTTTFPPDEVLHLIRLSTMVIHSCRGSLGLADYDFFNVRHYDEFNGEELTWELAAKMVNRSERFIRLIRAVAFGPGAKPPRLIQLSTSGNLLYSAMAKNPNWQLKTFESMGMGSRICCQLFKWLTSVVEIAIRQQEFLSLIATSFPDWLPKLNSLQCSLRFGEFEYELNKKCYAILNDHYETRKEDIPYIEILEKEMKLIKRTMNECKSRTKDILMEINKIKNDQSSREVVALQSMEDRCMEGDLELKDLAKQFQEFNGPAAQGDRRAMEKISELKHLLTNQKLKLTELQAQKKLLEIQVESNRLKRKDPAQLPPDILVRTILAGETKGAHIIASVDSKAMLKSAGVKDASDLPMHLLDISDGLALKESNLRVLSRQRYNEADLDRKNHDDTLTRQLQAQDVKEQKSKDQMMPTDTELEEERLENEKEAIAERVKHLQYIPDAVLYDIPKRPRPIIIAFSRDLAGYLKKRIHNHINAMMPGLFIYLNNTNSHSKETMGFDLNAMQDVLNSQKHILMNIDHGLTRVTRDSFLNNLEIILNSLYPKPIIFLAVGDEKNSKGDSDCQECGVLAEDFALLRDSKIKLCLEQMSWCAMQLIKPEIYKHAQILATDLMPRTKSLGVVLESYFILFANESLLNNDQKRNDNYSSPSSNYHLPNLAMPSMVWQRTRQMLMNLAVLYQHIYSVRRGSTPMQALNAMNQYLKHSLWPKISDEDRRTDLLLHTLATWMEKFVECELITLECGGMPLQSFTKSSLRGIQAVVTVKDALENLPKNLIVPLERNYQLFHWKQCSYNLIRNALQDLRVMKTVIKMNQQSFTVSVYRENNIIYFETYNPTTSEILMTSLTSDLLPNLIIPNGYERKLHSLTSGGDNNGMEILNPPQTAHEMYEKLIKLLKLRNTKDLKGNIVSKSLICQREYILLNQLVMRIDGFRCIVKCYESAYGELFFSLYLSEYSLTLTTHFTLEDRMMLIKHVDTKYTQENVMTMVNEARPLLPYVIDRLRIFPSRTMFLSALKGGGLFSNVYHDNVSSKEVKTTKSYEKEVRDPKTGAIEKKIVVTNDKNIINNPNIKDLSMKQKEKRGGNHMLVNQEERDINNSSLVNISSSTLRLKLKPKVHGKAGKVIYRRVIRIYEILFSFLIKLSTPLGIVIVYLYEPITRKTLELRITPFIRRILLDRSLMDFYQERSSSETMNSPSLRPISSSNTISGGGLAGKMAALKNLSKENQSTAGDALNKRSSSISSSLQVDNPRYNNISPPQEWIKNLVTLLKLQWNSVKTFSLELNQTLLKKVVSLFVHQRPKQLQYQVNPGMKLTPAQKQQKIRLLFHLVVLSETSVYLEINEFENSLRFGVELSRENIFMFLFHKTNMQILEGNQQNSEEVKGANSSSSKSVYQQTRKLDANLLGIINQIESEINSFHAVNIASMQNESFYSASSSYNGSHPLKENEIDPENEFKQQKFGEILLNSALLNHLIDKISLHLVLKNPLKISEGFQTIYFPVTLQIPAISKNFLVPCLSSALQEIEPPPPVFEAALEAVKLKESKDKEEQGDVKDVMSTARSSYSAASTVSGKDNEETAAAVPSTTTSPLPVAPSPPTAISKKIPEKKEISLKDAMGYENMKTFIRKKKLSKEPVYEYDSLQQRQQEKENEPSSSNQFLAISDETPSPTAREMENPLFNNKTHLLNNPETLNLSMGTLDTVLRTRYQGPVVNLEHELNLLAVQKSIEANEKRKEFERISAKLSQYMTTFNNTVILNQEIFDSTYSAAKDMLGKLMESEQKREEERLQPGKTQEELLEQQKEEERLQQELLEKEIKEKGEYYASLSKEEKEEFDRHARSEEHAIVNDEWKKVLEMGCKVNFREGKVTWHGHVSIAVEEDLCWVSDHGLGKRFKFIVYEPNCSKTFEGMIKSLKHLKEVLGMHGKDLLPVERQREMLIFICRYRLEVVVNKKTWDGADVTDPDAPPYRIEFQSDRLFTQDKITPVNAAEGTDEQENENKLFEIENARGKKIIRLVRRISGLLMQLTVFELPPAIAEAALLAKPVKGLVIQKNKSGAIESIEAVAEEENDDNTIVNEELPEEKEKEKESDVNIITKPKLDPESGPIENRTNLKSLKRHLPPAFRIVGYDPKSRRKVVLPVEPHAVIEVSGGIFSPYLQNERRRELARIVCESLILYFPNAAADGSKPSGGGGGGGLLSTFELMIPWSGNQNNQAINTIDLKSVGDDKLKKKKKAAASGMGQGSEETDAEATAISADLKAKNPRTAADRVMNRKGRIFRSVLRISNYELIVSIYQFSSPGISADGTPTTSLNNSIIINFYSPACTEAKEIILSEEQQIERISSSVVSFQEGAIRTAAIRRLMRFFKAEIIEDILDATIRELHVVLVPPGKDFITEYRNVSKPLPNENVRPSGLTSLFWPLDTCGLPLHRCGKTLVDRNNPQHCRDFLITIYTKSVQEFVERGVIIKLYDRMTCNFSVLHLSPSEMIRICNYYQEDNLLNDIVNSKIHEQAYQVDEIEKGLKEFTDKGKLEKKTNDLVKILLEIVVKDLGFFMSPQETIVPYMKSSPKGIFPE
jgi:hypothetical protein